MLNIAILSSASSIHTVRWANGLSAAGVRVHLISQQPLIEGWSDQVNTYVFTDRGVPGYFLMAPKVRKLLNQIRPDLVNAHYASGYGTTAHLANYRPWLLSVWGSDVYDFPYKSPLHRWGVASNLKAADAVASTSHCMSEQTRSLVPSLDEIAITPFGVDCTSFAPIEKITQAADAPLVIGTVKTLSPKYGIDVLIGAFALAKKTLGQTDPATAKRLRLRIVGGGPDAASLQHLARQLQVAEVVEFVGPVMHDQVPVELHKIHIFVALSRSESFGVAAIEAGAVGLPVLVSDAGGLPEVVLHGKTGLVVPKENAQAAADALLQLIQSLELRQQLGSAGRAHVLANYSWDTCVQNMIAVYERVITNQKKIE